MSVNAAALRIMQDKGLTIADAIEILEALERKTDRTGAERQRRHREKVKAERDTVTRDVTRDTVSPIEELHTPSGTDLSDEASASSPLRQPISEARDFWNETAAAVGWRQVRDLSPARAKLLGARLRQHGLDGWKAAVNRARASPYLAGADPPSWFTFPWLIKSENFLKTIEGNYDRNRSQAASGWQTAFAANARPG